MSDEVADWFANVENIRPVRGGRRANTLTSLARSENRISPRQAEDEFRKEFTRAQHSDDPLGILHGYVHWFQEKFPAGRPSLLYPMLYKMCQTYGLDERYQQDERLLNLWLELAENFPERGLAVMDFAFSKGSMRQMAKFYVRWSDMYDALKNSQKARETLELGIGNRALPLDTLHEARDRLEMRLMRDAMMSRSLDDSDYEERDMDQVEDDEPDHYNLPRVPIGRLQPLGEAREAPMIRRALATPLGPLRGLPQSTPQTSFRIFEDTPVQTPRPTPVSAQDRLADEFADDPDYQALFGYFDQRPKHRLHLDTAENHGKPVQWRDCAVKELPETPAALPEFTIFADEPTTSMPQPTPKITRPSKTRPQPQGKPKMKLRKDFALEMSVEEGYWMLIGQDKVHSDGSAGLLL